jgi:hypothetical protein
VDGGRHTSRCTSTSTSTSSDGSNPSSGRVILVVITAGVTLAVIEVYKYCDRVVQAGLHHSITASITLSHGQHHSITAYTALLTSHTAQHECFPVES